MRLVLLAKSTDQLASSRHGTGLVVRKRLETCSLAVEARSVRPNVLRRTARRLVFLQLILVFDHAGASSPVSETTVASHSERKVQIRALHADPVAHAFLVELVLLAIHVHGGRRGACRGLALLAGASGGFGPGNLRFLFILLLLPEQVLWLSIEVGL